MKGPDFWDVLNQALAVGRADGYIARRIRLHPTEYEQLREAVRQWGIEHQGSDTDRLYGVELVQDETCVEGPKVDWIAPLTQDKIDALERLLRDTP